MDLYPAMDLLELCKLKPLCEELVSLHLPSVSAAACLAFHRDGCLEVSARPVPCTALSIKLQLARKHGAVPD